ncbi:MAG: PKD domain-containing protein [Candidatus Heimdallarchaeota archaeon]|nr:PKD domain-containing protein [Candidatus Heimdallarchaeota archaeon]
MKLKFVLLLAMLCLSSLPMTPIYAQTAGEVPAAEFVSITPDGTPAGSFFYNINETITITYTADRFDVDGVKLLGTGSNLTENINTAMNLTKVSSFQGKSTYSVDINVSSYTEFYAYAWSVSFDNGTNEEFDRFDGLDAHPLWIIDGPQYPKFSTILGAEARNDQYYAPIGKEVTIRYTVVDPHDNLTLTLALGNNATEPFSSIATKIIMSNVSRSGNINTYEYNYTLTQRMVFFSAYTEYGWEREAINPETEKVHILTNGFSFTKAFSEITSQYTDIDHIKLNVTAYNQTDDDAFYVRYRSFNNDSDNAEATNWTINAFPANISYSLNNDSNNFNTTEHVYQYDFGTFNVSQVVEIQAFVEFKTGIYNESVPARITIQDSRPTIDILSGNYTILNKQNATIEFKFSTIRGEILNATLTSNYTAEIDITDKINGTVSFGNETIINGNHSAWITAFNDLNRSRTVLVLFHIDTIPPTANFAATSETKTDSKGKITIFFSFADAEATGSGVKFAEVDFGDGIAINATDLDQASHVYRKGGYFIITLTVFDKAGNSFSTEIEVLSEYIPPTTTTDSPINLVFTVLGIGIAVITARRRKY